MRLIKSRKVLVALATLIATALAEYGMNASPELITTILVLGASLILGIAHEDAGAKSAGQK